MRFRRVLQGLAVIVVGLILSVGIAGASLSVLLHVPRHAPADLAGTEIAGIMASDGALLKAS